MRWQWWHWRKTVRLTTSPQLHKGEVKTRKISAKLALRKCVEIKCHQVMLVKCCRSLPQCTVWSLIIEVLPFNFCSCYCFASHWIQRQTKSFISYFNMLDSCSKNSRSKNLQKWLSKLLLDVQQMIDYAAMWIVCWQCHLTSSNRSFSVKLLFDFPLPHNITFLLPRQVHVHSHSYS